MARLRVVTGYVPIANHPRSAQEYGRLGEKLQALDAPIQTFYELLGTCWLTRLVDQLPFEPTWSVGDNPQKNTLAYQCATHQKFEWLYRSSRMDDKADVFIWVDYGLAHIPGWSAAGMNEFLGRIKKNDFAIPGCWGKQDVVDSVPNWRFCGGLMVIPRKYVQDFKNGIQAIVMMNVLQSHNITWDVNHVAQLEAQNKLPIRWYKADHDKSIYENYR